MATSIKEDPKQKSHPQLIKLDKGFKLAEEWMKSMSKSSVTVKSTIAESEGRPSRLGIGATVPKEFKVTCTNDPVGKKLLANLQAGKREITRKEEDLKKPAKNGNVEEDSDEEESESKTKAFSKKRLSSLKSSLSAKKPR